MKLAAALTLALLAATWPLVRRLARAADARLPRWLREALPPALLFAATVAVYRQLAMGVVPTTHDHGFHMYKALETAELLRGLRLFGWSDLEYGGLPPYANYPFLGSLLTAALHALPGVGLAAAHAWSLLLCVASMSLAVYWAARLHFGRLTGLIAGLFALLDPGGWWVGGHLNTIEVGMWIQTFSTAFVVAALGLLPAGIGKGNFRALVGAGVLVGLGTCVHPQALLHTAVVAIPFAIAVLSTREVKILPALGRAAAFAGIAFASCAFWLIVYVSQRGFDDPDMRAPFGAEELWSDFVSGTLFAQPQLWMGAAIVGLLALAARRDAFSRFIALAVPFTVIVFNKDAMALLHLRDIKHSDFWDALQLERVFFLVRPLGMIAAAYGISGPLARALNRLGGDGHPAMVGLSRGVAGFLAAVLVMLPGVGVPGLPNNPVPQAFDEKDLADYNHALDAAQPLLHDGERLVLYEPDQYRHEMVIPAAERGLKILKIGARAAANFRNRLSTADPDLLERVGSTVLISKGDPPVPLRNTPVVGRFGAYQVRKLEPKPRAWIAGGPGNVTVEQFDDREVRVRVDGADPGRGQLVFGMDYYDRWLQPDGSPGRPFRDREANLISVPAQNGELVLRYVPPRAQWLGLAISLLGVAAVVAWSQRHRFLKKREVPAPAAMPPNPVSETAPGA